MRNLSIVTTYGSLWFVKRWSPYTHGYNHLSGHYIALDKFLCSDQTVTLKDIKVQPYHHLSQLQGPHQTS